MKKDFTIKLSKEELLKALRFTPADIENFLVGAGEGINETIAKYINQIIKRKLNNLKI